MAASSAATLRGPLLRVFFGAGAAAGKIGRKLLLIARVGKLAFELYDLLRRHLRVGLHHLHVLLRLGKLRLELPDLVLVGPAVELEQRLALSSPARRLDQHRGDQRRFGQARHELNGVLDHLRVVE